MIEIIAWSVVSFFSGALPLAVWLGTYGLKKDIRQFGDGNPGATNVWRAGGWHWGVLAVVLEFGKGSIPVSLALAHWGIDGWGIVPIALAPIMGHLFSPFLLFRGGKGLAVTFGIWFGLSLWQAPLLLGVLFGGWLRLTKREGVAVLAGVITFLLIIFLLGWDKELLLVAFGVCLLLGWSHRKEF